MENLKSLLARYWPTISLLVIGVILIVYIAFGFIYYQQGPQQRDFEEKINQLTVVLSRELPDAEELQKAYDDVNAKLAPLEAKDAIKIIVGIADKSGISVNESADKLLIPPASGPTPTKIGGNTYLVTTFSNIRVQGDHNDVLAFITDLDSGTTLPNMVLTKIIINNDIQIPYSGEEGARRAEFQAVQAAVQNMMLKNNLSAIPNPLSFAGNVATNFMGDDPETEETVEGFPDISTSAAEKGYTGDFSPRDGFALFAHDIVPAGEPTQFETVNYLPTLTTVYYYTCESDGTVRQWDGPLVLASNELIGREAARFEMNVILNVDIYTRTPD